MVALNDTYRRTHTLDRPAQHSGHRFYSPEISRWLSRDPIGERGGLNLYGFVGNDPGGQIDILGLLFGNCGDKAAAQSLLDSLETKFKDTDIWFSTSFNQAMAYRFQPAMNVPTWFTETAGGGGGYNALWNTLTFPAGGASTLVHELIHAYVDGYLNGISIVDDISNVQDEKLAHLWSLSLYPALDRFWVLETDGFTRPTCAEKQQATRLQWQLAWDSAKYAGKNAVAGILNTEYPLSGNDVVLFRNYFLLNLNCPTIAARYNDMASSMGCCFLFSCHAGLSSQTVARPWHPLPPEYQ